MRKPRWQNCSLSTSSRMTKSLALLRSEAFLPFQLICTAGRAVADRVFSFALTSLEAVSSKPHCNYIQELDGEEPVGSAGLIAAIA